jgi:hypothetical protein
MQIENYLKNENAVKHFEIEKTSAKVAISEALFGNTSDYIHVLKLYVVHFNYLPNSMEEINIDCRNARIWFLEKYGTQINETFYIKTYNYRKKKIDFDESYHFIFDDLLVFFNDRLDQIRFLFKNTPDKLVEDLMLAFQKFKIKRRPDKPIIHLISMTDKGMGLKKMHISKPKLNIGDNYNADFLAIHQTIYKRLSKKNDKGIVLLHGKPGTGKTTYIRYLMTSVKKDLIFLPPNMANAITNPNLINLLIENQNSILVIEDAENIIIDREKQAKSPVSALLNISDGLLADCLNIQIICSFNTDISKIDSALMRKGRLIAKYEFKDLETEKAQTLSSKLGFKTIINSPMSLTAIYNQDEQEFQQIKKCSTIGFKTPNQKLA